MNIDELNERLFWIWDHHPKQNPFMPIFFQPPKPNSIAFVGFNPAFKKENVNTLIKKDSNFPTKDFYTYCLFENRKNFDVRVSNQFDRLGEEQYISYFKPYESMQSEVNRMLNAKIEKQNLDLFFLRDSNQSNTYKDLFSNVKELELSPFGLEQFKLFEHFLSCHVKPISIMVTNALSRKIIKKYLADQIDSSEKETVGYESIWLNNRKVPLITTSSITGSRAIDDDTLWILTWMLKNTIKNELTTKPQTA